jgi:hypothetical protein
MLQQKHLTQVALLVRVLYLMPRYAAAEAAVTPIDRHACHLFKA